MIRILPIVLLTVFFSCNKRNDFRTDTIVQKIKGVADFELKHPSRHDTNIKFDYENGWVPATFYISLVPLYEYTGDTKYLQEVINWGEQFQWSCAPRINHADDIACGQVFLDLYRHDRDADYVEKLIKRMDTVSQTAEPGREEWHWCDALFMAPPTYVMASKILNDPKYLSFSDSMYWDVYNYLFDQEDSLFYRDKRYFDQRSPNGEKVFWGRGNGWVLGGLSRIIPYIENESIKSKYVDLYLKMSKRIAFLQQADGLWRSNLLDPDHYPIKETSSSGFFVYSLAWGINNGLLDKATYLPIVKKGWQGLVDCVDPKTGMIGFVQPIGAAPDDTDANTSMSYGAGAFVLAGLEMLKLQESYQAGLLVSQ